MLGITSRFIKELLVCLCVVNSLEKIKNEDKYFKKMYIVAKCIEDTNEFPKTSIDIMEGLFNAIILLYRDNKEKYLEDFAKGLEYLGKNDGELLVFSNFYKQIYDFLESDEAEKFVNGSIVEMNKDLITIKNL